MNRKIYTKSNRLNLIAALIFLSSFFSFSAMAQDKPLDAKSLAALIAGLKDVVSKNSHNEKESALVGEKWNKRQDLAGKTKTQVINLLYEDVKSVIKDSGTQYQISSIFSLYKQIPDENFSDKTGAKQTNSSKEVLVVKLIDLVAASHPYAFIEQELTKFPETADVTAAREADRKNRIEGFDAALKINNKLTNAQKKFVRANYGKLIEITDKITEDAIDLNFPSLRWILEGLENVFNERFTIEEINTLNAFFDSDRGEQVLNYVRQTEVEQLITGSGGKPDYTAADQAEYDKFVAAALGKKFIAAYLKETKEYVALKEGEVRRNVPNADGFAIYEPANLNKLFNKFVAKNYKK